MVVRINEEGKAWTINNKEKKEGSKLKQRKVDVQVHLGVY